MSVWPKAQAEARKRSVNVNPTLPVDLVVVIDTFSYYAETAARVYFVFGFNSHNTLTIIQRPLNFAMCR